MNQQITKERRSLERAPEPTRRPTRITEPEHPMERRSRLRIAEANARWHRVKEMIFVGLVAYLIVVMSMAGLAMIWSGTSTAVERQSGVLVLGTLFSMVLGAIVGKNLKWKN